MPDNPGTTTTSGTSTKTFDPSIFGLGQQLAAKGLQSPEALQTLQSNAMARQNDPVWSAMLTNSRNAVAGLASGQDKWQPTQGLQDFANGKYLSPESNPWLKGMYNDAADSVMGQLKGQFSGLGRYGSGAMLATQGDTLNRLANTLYGNAYQQGMQNMFGANTAINQGNLQGRNQQLAASALLPSAGIGNDAQLMQLAGLQQAALNGQYAGIAGLLGQGSTGSSLSQQSPYYTNDAANVLGGIGGALSIGNGLLNLGGKAGDLFSGWGGLNTGGLTGGSALPSSVDAFGAQSGSQLLSDFNNGSGWFSSWV